MKAILMLATLLVATVSFAQDYPTKTIKERLSGVKKTKRIYDVLTKDRTIRHGTYIETFKKDTIVQGQYFLNEKDGAWVYQDTKGLYLQKCFFNKGKKVGNWIAYSEGKLVSREYYSITSRLDSLFRYDYEGVLVKKYKYNSESDLGVSWEKRADGFVREATFLNEKILHGSESVYYPNGQLLQEKKHHKGKLYEVSSVYKNNGEIKRKSSFVNGKGVLISYHLHKLKEGSFIGKTSAVYKDSIPNGMYTKYNDSGRLIVSGVLVREEKIGVWKEFLSKKSTYKEKDYSKVKPVASRLKMETGLRPSSFLTDVSLSGTLVQRPPKLFQNAATSNFKHKKALSNCISIFFKDNLSLNELLRDVVDSPGKYRTMVMFKIDVFGEISDIKVRSRLGKSVENRIKEVFRKMPTFIPAYQNDRFVNLMFSLPITLRVKEKEEDPFKELKAMRY